MSALVEPDYRARVLIAAESVPTRVGLRLALGRDAECTEAGDEVAAVAAAVRQRPDVCLLDLDPAASLRALTAIVSQVPGSTVIVLARRPDESDFLATIRAGASGYLPHELNPTRLPAIVRAAMRGEVAVPRELVARLVHEVRDYPSARRRIFVTGRPPIEVTSREWETVDLLRRGLSTRTIADELRISQVTVRRHLSAAYAKLGVKTRAEALTLLEAEPA